MNKPDHKIRKSKEEFHVCTKPRYEPNLNIFNELIYRIVYGKDFGRLAAIGIIIFFIIIKRFDDACA